MICLLPITIIHTRPIRTNQPTNQTDRHYVDSSSRSFFSCLSHRPCLYSTSKWNSLQNELLSSHNVFGLWERTRWSRSLSLSLLSFFLSGCRCRLFLFDLVSSCLLPVVGDFGSRFTTCVVVVVVAMSELQLQLDPTCEERQQQIEHMYVCTKI